MSDSPQGHIATLLSVSPHPDSCRTDKAPDRCQRFGVLLLIIKQRKKKNCDENSLRNFHVLVDRSASTPVTSEKIHKQ